jgi:hypothetical protein
MDEVLKRLQAVTHLTLEYDTYTCLLRSHENNQGLYVIPEKGAYEIYKHNASEDYLLWSLLYTLVLLGGKTEAKIPGWVGKKWNEIS